MNLLKKPFSISLQALAHPFSEAASSPPGDKRDYMLVLNTYTESAPWSSHIINSIVAHIDQVDNFEVYTENMNSLLMTFKKHKTGEIESFKNNLLREYGKNPPRMLVLLGAPIAVLRDFVKQTWPGVPLILCSEMDYIGPENAYLDRRPLRPEERLPLCDKAVSDNITLIRTPLYLRENVELMRRMIPGMDSLIFVGDGRYINQQADSANCWTANSRRSTTGSTRHTKCRPKRCWTRSTASTSTARAYSSRRGITQKKSATTSSPSTTPTASSPACRPRCSR